MPDPATAANLSDEVTDRAVTLCSIDIMNGPSRSNIEVLIAITNMLLCKRTLGASPSVRLR